MTRYIIQLYTYNGDQIYGKHVECDRKDIPRKLTSIGVDYLRDNPYPGIIQALVSAGRNDTLYLIRLLNGTVMVYRYAFQCNVEEVGE